MTQTAEDFRARVRSWLEANAPRRAADVEPDDEGRRVDLGESKRFQGALHDAGLAGITWPKEYGGQGLSNDELLVFNEEAAEFELPTGPFSIGLGMCGPTVLELGTEEQRERYLRPLLRGEEVWCQLFSEPGAGSDVASLQTRAVRDGDEFVVNGQKVWTSGAQWSDFGILIARTDPDVPKHRGITMFILDMKSPGVTVRPLKDMSGSAPFNEVFFDDVRIPADRVVDQVNNGWQAAVVTLRHERVSIGTSVRSRRGQLAYESLADLARERGRVTDPVIRDELAEVYVKEKVVGLFAARLRQEAQAGHQPGARGSVAKLSGAVLGSRAAEVVVDILGTELAGWDNSKSDVDNWARAVNAIRSSGIAGGSNEIQRNIIGERVLGIPKDIHVDRDLAFRELSVNRLPDRKAK